MLSSKTEILSMGYVPSPVLGTQQEIKPLSAPGELARSGPAGNKHSW